jgi:hypothetical protein
VSFGGHVRGHWEALHHDLQLTTTSDARAQVLLQLSLRRKLMMTNLALASLVICFIPLDSESWNSKSEKLGGFNSIEFN